MNAGAKRRGDDAGKENNAQSAPKRRAQASAAAPRQSGAAAPLTALGVASAPPNAMNAGAKRRGDDAGKDKNARSAPKRRTQASAAAPPESPASCTEEQRGEFSAPKAFVLHGPNLVPPRSHPSPKH